MIAGIDYSINNPCICIHDETQEFKFKNCTIFYMDNRKKYAGRFGKNVFGLKQAPYETQTERYLNNANWALQILEKFNITEVGIEGYSYSSMGKNVLNMAENKMCLKLLCYQRGINLTDIPPSEVKKFFTGVGNVGKEEMVTQFIMDTNVHLHEAMNTSTMWSKPIDDIVDAFAVCKCFKETKL